MFTYTKDIILNIKPTFKIIFRTRQLKVGIIGVPFSRGQIKSGVEKAPDALRRAGLINVVVHMGHDVLDYGDICYNDKDTSSIRHGIIHDRLAWLPQVAVCSEKVSRKAEEVIADNRILLTIGGDHSVALGSVDGHLKAKKGGVCVVWVDAHPDLNTADTSPSGNVHGMTAALLVKEMTHFWPYLPGLDWQIPTISINRLAYIGLRSIDLDERVIIDKFRVTAFGMSEIEKIGIHRVAKEAIRRINPEGDRSIHISFDIDALDTLEAPSTGTPVRGGLTLREALILIETIQRTGRLAALDLVEINPLIGTEYQVKLTLESAMHIIKAAFAHSRSAYKVKHKIYPEASTQPIEAEVDFEQFQFIPLVKDIADNVSTKPDKNASNESLQDASTTSTDVMNDPKQLSKKQNFSDLLHKPLEENISQNEKTLGESKFRQPNELTGQNNSKSSTIIETPKLLQKSSQSDAGRK